ncbi:MAG: hypothetical protein NWE93_01240 [Candidatus Bathyarchaeota archaeon]|nr:hypothetical protein [Candidatus Bathyarchaeota archaeon]
MQAFVIASKLIKLQSVALNLNQKVCLSAGQGGNQTKKRKRKPATSGDYTESKKSALLLTAMMHHAHAALTGLAFPALPPTHLRSILHHVTHILLDQLHRGRVNFKLHGQFDFASFIRCFHTSTSIKNLLMNYLMGGGFEVKRK